MSEANVVITGMMGSGKSTVAPIVARLLKRPLLDTDVEIEKRVGKSIKAIVEYDGEAVFRKAEADLCEELAQKKGLVIATGGGFLVPFLSQQLMEPHSLFCLDASLSKLIERTKTSLQRPLLGQLKTLFLERQSAYRNILHHVDTNHGNVEAVANEIAERFVLNEKYSKDKMRIVRMPLQAPYPIVVKSGSAFEIEERLKWIGIDTERILVVTNEKIKSLYASRFDCRVEWLTIPDGEQHKTLDTALGLYQKLLSLDAKRDDVIVAFGGGVVGDIAGYVAATFMRGLRLVQIPTTLLAMVDSSIGGKTGVDLSQGKNLIGAFKQPELVLSDPALLNTLPKEERTAGMAEVVKHALIGDEKLFKALELGDAIDENMIFNALCVKAGLVEEDPFEHDRRALLNLGHTFGHAIEKVSDYRIRHGEAVAIGLVAACALSARLKIASDTLRGRVEHVLSKIGLPTKLPDVSVDSVLEAFRHDKKSTATGLRFVLPHAISDVRLHKGIDLKIVADVLLSLRGEIDMPGA